jgi:hypothetical protein
MFFLGKIFLEGVSLSRQITRHCGIESGAGGGKIITLKFQKSGAFELVFQNISS